MITAVSKAPNSAMTFPRSFWGLLELLDLGVAQRKQRRPELAPRRMSRLAGDQRLDRRDLCEFRLPAPHRDDARLSRVHVRRARRIGVMAEGEGEVPYDQVGCSGDAARPALAQQRQH